MGRKSPADERRKAEFREIARDILFKDREARKFRLKVDTGGAIARAMERVYQAGIKAERSRQEGNGDEPAASGEATQEGIAWITIPPRPRGAFWSIALWVIGDDLDEAEDRSYVLVFHHLSPLPDRWQSNFPGSVMAL